MKHLFQHRYDYRAEWLRFTDTLGGRGDAAAARSARRSRRWPTSSRRPAACCCCRRRTARCARCALELARARRRRHAPPVPRSQRICEETGRIIELDALRIGREIASPAEAALVPDWLRRRAASAWIAVPLVHFGRLAGVVLLARPLIDRPLDWEDFDLLRVAGTAGGELSGRGARAGGAGRGASASTSSTAASPSSCTTSRTSCRS